MSNKLPLWRLVGVRLGWKFHEPWEQKTTLAIFKSLELAEEYVEAAKTAHYTDDCTGAKHVGKRALQFRADSLLADFSYALIEQLDDSGMLPRNPQLGES